MRKTLLIVALTLLAVYVALCFALTSVVSIPLIGKKAVVRTCDSGVMTVVFWPIAQLEGRIVREAPRVLARTGRRGGAVRR